MSIAGALACCTEAPAPAPASASASAPAPAPAPASAPAPAGKACAPSLASTAPRDARTQADLARCRFERTGHDDIGNKCAARPHPVSLDRLDEAVSLNATTIAHAKAQWQRGTELGRAPHVVGFVGDSITESPKFMTSVGRQSSVISADVRARLTIGGETIIDRYAKHLAVADKHSFIAPRAAEMGVLSGWAVRSDVPPEDNRIGQLIRSHSPSMVVVMFGTNDAFAADVPHDQLSSSYRKSMTRIVDQLEAAGVVVILNTLPRHTYDPDRLACDEKIGDLSNWRIAVQTSALSAAVAELACARNLPLIDLRHALDATLNHGIGPDGVHPTAHPLGSAKLDADGLRCGYNVRNYVTLRMLRELHVALGT